MNINKEREGYLKMLVGNDAISNDQANALKLISGDSHFYTYGNQVSVAKLDLINWGWNSWVKAKFQAVPEWISVKDNLPPANILVLGMSQTRSNIFNIYNVMALDEFEEADVTHWMPLPDAPQEPTND